MRLLTDHKFALRAAFAVVPILSMLLVGVVPVTAQTSGAAVIKGVVKTDGGPIADATIAIFKAGTATLLKQVQSAADGSFLARITPGKYTVLAVAQGFTPITISEVDVERAAQLTYGFKLERVGNGNTLPEKRVDRNNPKWVRRSATLSRSIYQNSEGEDVLAEAGEPESQPDVDRKAQTVSETYFASTDEGSFVGLNFATFLPVTESAELVLAAQVGAGSNAPQRFETQAKFRPNDSHQIRVGTSIGKLGKLERESGIETLNQISLQATDEWKIREGVVLVYGFDYARFFGAGNDSAVSPRLGFQYDVNSKTRVRSAFTTQTEDKDWSRAIALEDAQVIFREPVAMDDILIEDGKPVMNRTSRFEIGFERVLDNKSSLDANFFADTTFARGVGVASMPFVNASFGPDEFTGNQQGNAQGASLVYSRRISGRISAKAGYSFGRGQSLSMNGISNPAELFENSFFQSFFGQVDADFKTGTNVKTVFRLSPDATVFAIDPFHGKLAIYDPSMSILVTQNLPTLGLPIHAQAVLDARNIFDFQAGISGDDGSLRLTGQGRTLRGGILVRF
ncbi:MAG: carboxypeptidase-like regulatory domain-containing protein [bacterium]|nr:carboxypeptidase-like regulatory domain-containing protein [bacterium]